MARSRSSNGSDKSNASLGFEAKRWQAADKLRNNMDAAEYKHVVLGFIFLKYISDTFEEHYANPTTRRLAIMNLALRGIEADFGPENADTFCRFSFDLSIFHN